jgi:ketosteroid isomerase-like protein
VLALFQLSIFSEKAFTTEDTEKCSCLQEANGKRMLAQTPVNNNYIRGVYLRAKESSMRSREQVVVGLVLLVLSASAATRGQTSRKETDAILATDAAWLNVYQLKDLDKSVAFCDEQGSMLAPNTPIAVGKDAIAKLIAEDFAHDNIEWHANKVGVSSSGDLGYTSGTTGMTFKDTSGKTVVYKGKYLTVWKKQADGSWKVLYDMFNSDQPPTP